jgi:hypothetical protein
MEETTERRYTLLFPARAKSERQGKGKLTDLGKGILYGEKRLLDAKQKGWQQHGE